MLLTLDNRQPQDNKVAKLDDGFGALANLPERTGGRFSGPSLLSRLLSSGARWAPWMIFDMDPKLVLGRGLGSSQCEMQHPAK